MTSFDKTNAPGPNGLSGDGALQSAPTQPVAPKVSVVIVSWNGWAKLHTCLRSIYGGCLPSAQVIVIDNDSADGTPKRVREFFPRVELHRNRTNLGHTKAINQGFLLARGEYILVLDPDTELAADCIEGLVEFLDARPEVAMVAPRTFNSDGTVQETARNFPGISSGLFGRQSMLTRLLSGNRFSARYLARDHLDASEPFQVEQIGGACMFFRRELIRLAGLWDEGYFAYWVDTDWCRSVSQKGLPIYCVPSARMIHHEGNARRKRKSARRIWLFHYGAYRYYTKWHCRGPWDPRAMFAGAMLAVRGVLQIALNARIPLVTAAEPRPPVVVKPEDEESSTADRAMPIDRSNRA